MTLAIMQPYAFPYLGYFQLAAIADRFVLLDNVAFGKRGWINRNRILDSISGEAQRFTIHVRKAPSATPIDAIQIDPSPRWRRRLLLKIEKNYDKAPQFATAWPLVERLLSNPEPALATFIRTTLVALFEYLGIATPLVAVPPTGARCGQERILEICRLEGATDYLNLEGGRALYDTATFAEAGFRLHFLEHQERPYPQFDPEKKFVPRLSIIDAIMFNAPEQILTEHLKLNT